MSTVLVVGSGGREHALGWKLAQSLKVMRIILAPGNDGMPAEWERWSIPLSSRDDFYRLADKASAERVDLAVIGPDNPLADGIVDVLESRGILTLGPRAQAAQIEASKSFAKEIMRSVHVPTAQYWIAETQEEARKILKSVPWNSGNRGWVVKADGLAFGKGVHVCHQVEEAFQAVDSLIGISGKLVIEEKLPGEELSWMAFCDGERCALLEPARDYKRLLDQNQGPNTGGMGAVSPVPDVPVELAHEMKDRVFLPVLQEMKRRGSEFRGLLYAGLMWDRETRKYWVLEFNARFGDPETQVLIPRIQGDLFPWLEAVAKGNLRGFPDNVPFISDSAVFVVAAAKGYPDAPERSKPIRITGQESQESQKSQKSQKSMSPYFFAAVKREGHELLSAGGRVFGSLGMGSNIDTARKRAYENLGQISFEGMQYRSDIGRFK